MSSGTMYPIIKVGTSVMIGDYAGGNYIEIEEDGTIRNRGTSIAFIDAVADLAGKKIFSNTGRLDTDWDNNALLFQDGGNSSNIDDQSDRVVGNVQNNHQHVADVPVDFIFHFHWFQQFVKDYKFAIQYRLVHNGGSFVLNDPWTQVDMQCNATVLSNGGNVFPFVLDSGDDTMGQISVFPVISLTMGISDTFQYRFARIDEESGDVLVYFNDVHLPVDSFGSDEPISKTT